MRRYAALALLLALTSPANAFAWGMQGHTMISRLAAQNFPADMPAFVRTATAANEIATLGPEEDRLKGSGASWDADNDPGHYLNVADDGTIDGVSLHALPESMKAYALALEQRHATPWSVGYLPYSILDGFEQLRQDFALWRVYNYGAQHASTAAMRAQFGVARRLREILTLRDLGVWSHFIADGSQPLHVTVHFNGWGRYPDPQAYTQAPIHSVFESDFVDRYVSARDVRAQMRPEQIASPARLLSQSDLDALVATYLEGTASAMVPLYRIAGPTGAGFKAYSAQAADFAARQLARGADELRDLSDLAWRDSPYVSVGYPYHPVLDILRGKVPLSTLAN
ncbi:MAG TPA: S1/P1 Nuclease [Candidatus Dormibacteraeota bacterium]|nr:S1/P1 Nuclease [Candidatus Dormibacteraeota bacterium]